MAETGPAWQRQGDLEVTRLEVTRIALLVLLLLAPGARAADVERIGPMLDVQGIVEGDVTLAGGRVSVEADITGDMTIAGGSIGIGAGTRVKRNVFLFGAEIAMAGTYAQRVWIAGDQVVLDIQTAGDVSVAASRVIVGPHTRIGGALKVWSPDPPELHADARMAGGLVHHAGGIENIAEALMGFVGTVLRWGFYLLMGATTLVLAVFAPGWFGGALTGLRTSPGQAALWGGGLLAGLPLMILLAAITVIGLPVAGALVLIFAVALGVSYGVAAGFVGEWGLRLAGQNFADGALWRLAAVIGGLVVLAALRHIPVVASLVLAFAFVFGLGAVARETVKRLR